LIFGAITLIGHSFFEKCRRSASYTKFLTGPAHAGARRIYAVGGVPVLRREVLRDAQREAFLPLGHEPAVDDEQPARPHETVLAEELMCQPEEPHAIVFVGRNERRAAPLGAEALGRFENLGPVRANRLTGSEEHRHVVPSHPLADRLVCAREANEQRIDAFDVEDALGRFGPRARQRRSDDEL
jgi:hypothetical protein